ncbi:MAG: peptidoglycan-binding protein [Eubacteriales bacterium]|nr:peptidoglycan-binding protein [Eubacteriales bacterium]
MKRFIILLSCMVLLFSAVYAENSDGLPIPEDEIVIVSSDMRELKRGDRGDEVRALQTRLRDVKYYTAKVTGNYLEVTEKAVKKVQEAYGLPVTGVADAKTLEIIYGDCHRPLKSGDQGKDVSRLQTTLSELGFYSGNVSGNYMQGTKAAIESFQKANGIEVTGEADVNTQIKLYSGEARMATPDPNRTPSPVPKPTPEPDLSYPGKLSYGSKGERVRQLQERLMELGYFNRKSTTTGFYKMTQASLKAFQKQNGIDPDGVLDEITWQALYSEDVAGPYDVPRPSPVPKPQPYFIDVDVNNQLIKIYGLDEEGNYTKFIRAMWCSTGTTSYPSDIGTFTLTERRALWAEFPTWGGGKARYWTKITPSIAFHSFMYGSYDVKNVNMKSVNRLGKRASHGCIRLTLHDAKWIYQNCKAGTQVKIHEDGILDPELKAASKPATYDKKLYAHPITPTPSIVPSYNPAQIPQGDIKELKVNSKGEAVFWLQNRLKELGYYKGTVTGEFLDGTKKAVQQYQKDNGLNASGRADKKTLEMLYSLALEEFKTPAPLPTDVPVPVPLTPAP